MLGICVSFFWFLLVYFCSASVWLDHEYIPSTTSLSQSCSGAVRSEHVAVSISSSMYTTKRVESNPIKRIVIFR